MLGLLNESTVFVKMQQSDAATNLLEDMVKEKQSWEALNKIGK